MNRAGKKGDLAQKKPLRLSKIEFQVGQIILKREIQRERERKTKS